MLPLRLLALTIVQLLCTSCEKLPAVQRQVGCWWYHNLPSYTSKILWRK